MSRAHIRHIICIMYICVLSYIEIYKTAFKLLKYIVDDVRRMYIFRHIIYIYAFNRLTPYIYNIMFIEYCITDPRLYRSDGACHQRIYIGSSPCAYYIVFRFIYDIILYVQSHIILNKLWLYCVSYVYNILLYTNLHVNNVILL